MRKVAYQLQWLLLKISDRSLKCNRQIRYFCAKSILNDHRLLLNILKIIIISLSSKIIQNKKTDQEESWYSWSFAVEAWTFSLQRVAAFWIERPRTSNFLVRSPFQTVFINISWLFLTELGPSYKNVQKRLDLDLGTAKNARGNFMQTVRNVHADHDLQNEIFAKSRSQYIERNSVIFLKICPK